MCVALLPHSSQAAAGHRRLRRARARPSAVQVRSGCITTSSRLVYTVLETPPLCSAFQAVVAPTPAANTSSMDMSTSVTLDNIRSALIRQEDTIIFNLIERAQFASNPLVYASGGIPVPGGPQQQVPGFHQQQL